ncbi:hypothetical protein TWF281_006520 [Arthrobotrys megalospora]
MAVENKSSLNPSAPVFNPTASFGPGIPVPSSPLSDSSPAEAQECLANSSLSTWGDYSGTETVPHEISPREMEIAELVDSKDPDKSDRPHSGMQIQPSPEIQQRLERLVYLTTRDIFLRSPFKQSPYLSSGAAQRILKEADATHPELLLHLYRMDELVETLVAMNAEQVYTSTPEAIKEKWPWLLDGDISELAATEFSKPPEPCNGINKKQAIATFRRPPSYVGQETRLSSSTFLNVRGSRFSNSILDDNDARSMMSFDLSAEISRTIDPYGTYFPYPTLRTILKESRRILKSAFYEFTKKYLPEMISQEAFEFIDSSSLGQLILMVQDTISEMDEHRFTPETREKLIYLRDLDSKAGCLNSASELYDLVSRRRRDIDTSELYLLLNNLLGLIDALGAPEWSKKQRALNKYTAVLATDLKKKFEEIQAPLRTTLRRISDQRETLDTEEKSADQKYRRDKKEIQSHFMVNTETLHRALLSDENSVHKIRNFEVVMTKALTKNDVGPPSEDKASYTKNAILLTPPDICVWDPQKQLIDYCPGGTQLPQVTKDNTPTSFRRPWDTSSIDLAINALNSKENIYHSARQSQADSSCKGNSIVQGKGFQGFKNSSQIMIPPAYSKAIPIKKAESIEKVELITKHTLCEAQTNNKAQDLECPLIEL